jgi:ZIP family zinc transporter
MTDFVTPLLMSLIAGAATLLGAVLGVIKRLSMKYFDLFIGFAAGVMLSVATFGLIDQGIALIKSGNPTYLIALIIVSGITLGMIVLLILDKVLPHLHTLVSSGKKGVECEKEICRQPQCPCPNEEKWMACPYLEDGICKAQGGCFCPKKLEFQTRMKYSGLLLLIGLTIHNVPEGIAVGVGFLAITSLGFSLTFAIALHNIPEGLAIAVPLMQTKYRRRRILTISFLSGMTEPLACLIALFLLQSVSPLILAFFLAFAGGAMIYITGDELIPESHKHGYEHEATIGLLLGFILMLVLIIGFNV